MALIIDGLYIEEGSSSHDNMPVSYANERGEQDITEDTELGAALRELNNDNTESGHRMSGIDMRTRLHYTELASVLAIDTLVAFKFLPMSCLVFTRQKKRLAVSLAGKGREEIVSIVHGKQGQDENKSKGFFSKWLSPKAKPPDK